MEIIKYKDLSNRDVEFTLDILKRVLPELKKVKDEEVYNFALRCKAMGVNPLVDVHNVKFGDAEQIPVVKKDFYIKNANSNKDYAGFKAGVVVVSAKDEIIEREGTIVISGEELVGGWARLFTKERGEYYVSVSIEEYIGRTKAGVINSMWSSKPATMIRKVAISQVHREAFPDFSGTYSEEEIFENETIDAEAEVIEVVETHDIETQKSKLDNSENIKKFEEKIKNKINVPIPNPEDVFD